MSDEYRAEVERFINRSLDHLKRKGRDGIHIIIHSTNKETGERYRGIITIQKEDEEEDEH